MPGTREILICPIERDSDLLACRQMAQQTAIAMGFQRIDQVRITTAVSEIVRNVLSYAASGQMTIVPEERYLEIIIEDHGPGISNLEQVQQDGFSTSHGMGIGVPGSKRLMDDFSITSTVGVGTRVAMRKCLTG